MSNLKPTRLARVLLLVVNLFYYFTLFGGIALLAYMLLPIAGIPLPPADTVLPVNITYANPPESSWNTAGGQGTVAIQGHDWTSLKVHSPLWQAAGALADLVFWAMLVFTAYQLRAFLQAVSGGAPFIPANPRRIRLVGLLIIAVDIFTGCWTWFLSRMIAPHLALEGAVITPHFGLDWTQLLLGLLILIIAQIFELGVQLEEEQALTV